MVDSENSSDNYKILRISIGAIIMYLLMLTFVPDLLKTKRMCKNAGKKLPFVIKNVRDCYRLKKCVIKLF